MGGLLSLLGVLVVARNEVFLAAAVAQASVLGVAVALAFGWENPAIYAVIFSILAALATSRNSRGNGGSRDETTAWTFLITSSLAVLLLSRSPVGMKNVQSILTSSLLGASRMEAVVFAALFCGLAGLIVWNVRRFTLMVMDPVMAAAVGLSVPAWSLVLSALLGLVSGLAIRSTGLLFTFGCLVLPALIARNLCRNVGPMFVTAPAVGLLAVLAGLMGAHAWDFPPGQLVVALLGATLVLAWMWRELRQRMFSI